MQSQVGEDAQPEHAAGDRDTSSDIYVDSVDIYGDERFPNNDGFDPESCAGRNRQGALGAHLTPLGLFLEPLWASSHLHTVLHGVF